MRTLFLAASTLALFSVSAAHAGGFAAPVVDVAPVAPVVVAETPAWQGGYVGAALGYAFGGDDRIGENVTGTLVDNLGKAELGGKSQTIRTIATVADAQQLADFSITLGHGRSVRLSSLARVHDATADATQLALLDGKPVVGFSMSRSRGADELRIVGRAARQVRVRVDHVSPGAWGTAGRSARRG